MSNLALLERYFRTIESGATGEALAAFFTNDVRQREFPNPIVKSGMERDLNAILEAAQRGQAVLSSQTFTVQNAVEVGEALAVEVLWEGVVKIPLGTLVPGDTMRCHSGMFLTFRDGKIATQKNYDCFEPFGS